MPLDECHSLPLEKNNQHRLKYCSWHWIESEWKESREQSFLILLSRKYAGGLKKEKQPIPEMKTGCEILFYLSKNIADHNDGGSTVIAQAKLATRQTSSLPEIMPFGNKRPSAVRGLHTWEVIENAFSNIPTLHW